jgi:ketosteroid isomerase-like protein
MRRAVSRFSRDTLGDSIPEILGPVDRERARRNVAILKRGATAIGDDDVEALMSLVSDDFELHPAIAGAFVGATVYRGKDGARRYVEDIKGVFRDLRLEPFSFSAWDDYLICRTRVFAYGTTSGAEIDLEATMIWRVRDGLAHWGATFFNREDALKAIGASEDKLELIE